MTTPPAYRQLQEAFHAQTSYAARRGHGDRDGDDRSRGVAATGTAGARIPGLWLYATVVHPTHARPSPAVCRMRCGVMPETIDTAARVAVELTTA